MTFFGVDNFKNPERDWLFGFDVNLFDNNVSVIGVTELDFILVFSKHQVMSFKIFVKHFDDNFVIFGIDIVVVVRRAIFLHEEDRFLKSSRGQFIIIVIVLIVIFTIVCFDIFPLFVWWVDNSREECYSYNDEENP